MAISQRLYNEIMMTDDFTCVYCGLRTPDITIDHFVPKTQGGPDVLANLYACCRPCNNRKGGRSIDKTRMPLVYGRFRRLGATAPKTIIPSPKIDPGIPEEAKLLTAIQLKRDGKTKQESIERAFGIKKGGSPAWKRASDLFDAATIPTSHYQELDEDSRPAVLSKH